MQAKQTTNLAITNTAKRYFGITVQVRQMIGEALPISHTGTAYVFLSHKKQLYALIQAQSNYTLGDVKRIITRMGLKAEHYLPPAAQPSYFDDFAAERFRETYPGRTPHTEDDLRFFKTLAPYNPALVAINEVKHGEIKQFDASSPSQWRPAATFMYRRMPTS